jgi:hypothetical protein
MNQSYASLFCRAKSLPGISVRLASLALVCTILLTPASAVFFSASIDQDLYGNLDQSDVPGIEGCACGPTSVVNSLVYLQNVAPHIYGDNTLVPHSEEPIPTTDMADVATILAGPDYMDTGNNNGTFIEDFIYGKHKYIEERAPGKTRYAAQVSLEWRDGVHNTAPPQPTHQVPKPSWVQDQTAATLEFIYNQIRDGEDVEVFVAFGGGAHYLTVTGIEYDDTTNQGMLDFIDPSGGMPGDASINGLNMNGVIQLSYNGGSSLFHAVSESPIPEPMTIVLVTICLAALAAQRRRLP